MSTGTLAEPETSPKPPQAQAALAFKPTRKRARRRKASAMAVTVLITLLTVFTGGGSANAGFFDPVEDLKEFLCPTNPPFAQTFGGGIDGLIPQQDVGGKSANDWLYNKAIADKRLPANNHSVYEQYGTIGTQWTTYDTCVLEEALSEFANIVFQFGTLVNRLTISTYQWATSPTLLGFLTFEGGPLDVIIRGGCTKAPTLTGNAELTQNFVSECSGGLMKSLFLNYLPAVVVLGALAGAWQGLVQKRNSEVMKGWVWMVLSAGFALGFLQNPSLVARTADNVVSKLTGSFTSSMLEGGTVQGGADLCVSSGNNLPDANGAPGGNRAAANALYCTFVFTPWAQGEFGVFGDQKVIIDGLDWDEKNADRHLILRGTTVPDARFVQMDINAFNHDQYVSNIKPRSGVAELKKAKEDQWNSMAEQLQKDGYEAQYEQWKGANPGSRMVTALTALVAAFIGGLLILLVSFSTIILHLAMVLLIFAAPLFLLIGVQPTYGRGIALKWLEMLLGTMLKRVVLGFVLALLGAFYQIILSSGMGFFTKISMIAAFGITLIMYRKKILDMFDVIKLGGSGANFDGGNGRGAKKAPAALIGGAAGANQARNTGGAGAMLGGMVMGGMMGSRSGSPMRAATMGNAAGRRVGGRAVTKAAKLAKAGGAAGTGAGTGVPPAPTGRVGKAAGRLDERDAQANARKQARAEEQATMARVAQAYRENPDSREFTGRGAAKLREDIVDFQHDEALMEHGARGFNIKPVVKSGRSRLDARVAQADGNGGNEPVATGSGSGAGAPGAGAAGAAAPGAAAGAAAGSSGGGGRPVPRPGGGRPTGAPSAPGSGDYQQELRDRQAQADLAGAQEEARQARYLRDQEAADNKRFREQEALNKRNQDNLVKSTLEARKAAAAAQGHSPSGGLPGRPAGGPPAREDAQRPSQGPPPAPSSRPAAPPPAPAPPRPPAPPAPPAPPVPPRTAPPTLPPRPPGQPPSRNP